MTQKPQHLLEKELILNRGDVSRDQTIKLVIPWILEFDIKSFSQHEAVLDSQWSHFLNMEVFGTVTQLEDQNLGSHRANKGYEGENVIFYKGRVTLWLSNISIIDLRKFIC